MTKYAIKATPRHRWRLLPDQIERTMTKAQIEAWIDSQVSDPGTRTVLKMLAIDQAKLKHLLSERSSS